MDFMELAKNNKFSENVNPSLHGHASFGIHTFTVDGMFHETRIPRDALNLAAPVFDIAAYIHSDSSKLAELEELIEGDDYRCEYYAMQPYRADNCYTISHSLGYKPGKQHSSILNLPPKNPDKPVDLIIWDSDYGGLQIPENCRTVFWLSDKVLPDRKLFAKIAPQCFLFLDADVLRSKGAMISRQISWERTVADLMEQLQNNKSISYLMDAPHILIPFAEDGAVLIDNMGGQPTAFLTLTHGGSEGTLREKISGYMDNTFASMVLVLVQMFLITGDKPTKPENIRFVLEAAELTILQGYDFGGEGLSYKAENMAKRNWPMFPIPQEIKPDWTIANDVSDKQLHDVAFNYVLKGSEVIDGLPQLKLGKLITVDRWEIEAYQDIRNLIISYTKVENTRPLSIAVFGSPGSGKSFGVTEIAENISDKIEQLEFNVSQFTSLSDLGVAFQKVRDTILRDKLPLVFFDEFDSDYDGRSLGWIKSFLMPMQDGKFRDDSGEHPLGKCILVFAGGTASSFEEFTEPMNFIEQTRFDSTKGVWVHRTEDPKGEQNKLKQNFKNIKGPDFISRLRGTINVLGPNPKDDADKNYILRRALLLRSLCKRNKSLKFDQNIAPISPNIIHAMLHVPEYKHGARSMEAILDMSNIEGNSWEPASLPSRSQLALHVDADAFINLVLNNRLLTMEDTTQ